MNENQVHVRRYTIPIVLLLLLASLLGTGWAGAGGRPQDVPAWGPDVRANSDDSGWSQHEPHLAISRTDPNVVVSIAKDYRVANNKEVWIYVSQDGGRTWPLEKQLQIPGMPPDIPNQSDPVVMARDDGRLYAFCLGHGGGHGLFVSWSDDDGDTWLDPSVRITYNETPGSLDDKEWPAIDNNPASPYYHNMYIAWANGGILFKYSTDGGATWSSYVNLTPGLSTEYPYPVVAADGSLYVFYMHGWGYCADGYIEYRKSTDGGVTFEAGQTVVATSQPCSPIHGSGGYDQWRFFSIITAAVDPNDPSNLWVAWTDDNNVTYGKVDVLYVHSTDGGANWSAPARLSHDDPDAYVDHITPVFAVQSLGAVTRLHAFWLDRREDPANILFHGYHTSTTDGGETWSADTRTSDDPFDLNVGFPPPPGYNAAGDYWGLDAVGNVVMTAWNTTVRGEQDIYVSRGVFTTTVVTLTGLVSDAQTALPIPGAHVKSDPGVTMATGPDGIYRMVVVPGAYTATASAAGYVSQSVALELVSGTVVQDFNLEPILEVVTLTGQVSDAQTALPVAGALVEAGAGLTTTTDVGGLYTLTLDPGLYTVTASAAGYWPETVAGLELVSGTVVQDFNLEPILEVVTLTGQVSDVQALQPIAGVLVDAGAGLTTTTDVGGLYTLTLDPGLYTVTASAAGYWPETVAGLELVSGTVVQDFSLQPIACPAPSIEEVHVFTDGLTATFSATVSATLPVQYLWAFGDGVTGTQSMPTHTYASFGTYAFTLTVENACGTDTVHGQVVLPVPLWRVYLPLLHRGAGGLFVRTP